MNIDRLIVVFAELGRNLKNTVECVKNHKSNYDKNSDLIKVINTIENENPWFIKDHVLFAIESIAESLQKNKLEKWLYNYRDKLSKEPAEKKIGVVMAGNIPVVGFHDFLCVLISGNKFIGKLSTQDNKLLPAIADILIEIDNKFKQQIIFTEERIRGFDAIIATGTNNTARYFNYYFGKYPNIIRKNKNAVAVLNGKENNDELGKLGIDIFMHFGLGCRSVSKIYVPENYSFNKLFDNIKDYHYVIDNHKYRNNYDYYKSIYLLNRDDFMDNDFVILKKHKLISSPVSVIHYEYYTDIINLTNKLNREEEKIQCIVSNIPDINNTVSFGRSQSPELWDYADNTDTMNFLLDL